jgi:hypothetical protein
MSLDHCLVAFGHGVPAGTITNLQSFGLVWRYTISKCIAIHSPRPSDVLNKHIYGP